MLKSSVFENFCFQLALWFHDFFSNFFVFFLNFHDVENDGFEISFNFSVYSADAHWNKNKYYCFSDYVFFIACELYSKIQWNVCVDNFVDNVDEFFFWYERNFFQSTNCARKTTLYRQNLNVQYNIIVLYRSRTFFNEFFSFDEKQKKIIFNKW